MNEQTNIRTETRNDADKYYLSPSTALWLVMEHADLGMYRPSLLITFFLIKGLTHDILLDKRTYP